MEINGIEIKPGMGLFINNKESENLYVVIPIKNGLGVIAYGKSRWWERLNVFLEAYRNEIIAISDISGGVSISGDILWEKPKEYTMQEIADKLGIPVEQLRIKK